VAEDEFQRFVLLNRPVSRAVTRAPEAFKSPIVERFELLTILEERNAKCAVIEFFGASDAEKDADETDDERIARSAWLREIKIATTPLLVPSRGI
jgi:hypothetical protein